MALVYEGIYTIDTEHGRFAFLMFSGATTTYESYTFHEGDIIEGSLLNSSVSGFSGDVAAVGNSITINGTIPWYYFQSPSLWRLGRNDSTAPRWPNAASGSNLTCLLGVAKSADGSFYYLGTRTIFANNVNDYDITINPPENGKFGYGVIVMKRDVVFPFLGLQESTSGNQQLTDLFNGATPFQKTTDPYEGGGGASDVGGGTGNFDGTSVDVDFASLPTLSAVDTGFISLYNPNLTQLQLLANYMWSDLFDLDTFKKLFSDPMQAILGLSIVPGPVPSGAAQVVKVGNISTGVSMPKAASQYINVDCGTLNVEEFWGAYLDYEPYTKAEIFLPFIGVHQIAVDDIMNKPVHIMYHIDLLSGGCACEIKCGGSVLYTFIGSCAVSVPVTGSDWTNLINGVLSAASAIGTMVATGGATAPAAAGEIASAAVNSLKPSIEKSGSIAGAGGLLAGKVPVLILTRPRQALPGNQNTFTGYPAFITRSLGALSGYTEVHSIRLSGIDGTESEIDEIEELLKGGVIL